LKFANVANFTVIYMFINFYTIYIQTFILFTVILFDALIRIAKEHVDLTTENLHINFDIVNVVFV
jgi:hypothetical protein